MSVSPGTKLGPYEITGALGAGGMGEVYRARDTRLDRTVAIKVLPSHLSDNPDLKQRFEREARAISSLNHPHICHLYDVGRQDGTDFLVMEYLEGETLSDRLAKGALPIDQVLKIGREIADALDKAHRQGIVHRDLKPGNIMLTKSGAKLMDFGLAKTAAMAIGAAGGSQSHPTKTPTGGAAFNRPITHSSPTTPLVSLTAAASPLTQQGTIVGTFQYMAPEVLQGAEADARSDIFSFGCVLYEMATAHRAFEGKSQLSVLTAILENEPAPLATVQPMAPRAFDRLVHACLVKDPQERLQTAHDIALQLGWLATAEPEVTTTAATTRARLPLIAVAVLLLLLVAGALATYRLWPHSTPMTASINAPENFVLELVGDDSGPPVLSPDGSLLVFRAHSTGDNRPALWLRHMDTGSLQRLDGTDEATFPFWSPDGRNLAFFALGKLSRIGVSGGTVSEIAPAPLGRGGSWGKNDVILFTPDFQTGIFRVSSQGGSPVAVTKLDPSRHTTHRWPVMLPDGQHFIYSATNHSGGDPRQNGVFYASLDGKVNRLLMNTDASPFYASGYLLFETRDALRAQAFDPDKGTLSGDAITLSDRVQFDAATWHASFTASQNGLLVYAQGGKAASTRLVWSDRTGKSEPISVGPADYRGTRLSPDGRRVAVIIASPYSDLWVIDLDRGTPTRVTFDPTNHLSPVWSADGKMLAYTAGKPNTAGIFDAAIYARNADGSGAPQQLLAADPIYSYLIQEWTADGRYLVYLHAGGPSGHAVWALSMFGDRKPFEILAPPSPQSNIEEAHVSPDGK